MNQVKLIKLLIVFVFFIFLFNILIFFQVFQTKIIINRTIFPQLQILNEKQDKILTEMKQIFIEQTSPPPQLPSSFQEPQEKEISILTNISFSTNIETSTQKIPVTVNIEKVSKLENKIVFEIKVMTSRVDFYSSLDINKLFEKIDLSKDTSEIPSKFEGPFYNLKPRSINEGKIIFEIEPDQKKFIFRLSDPDNPLFYEFDFENKTYKEIIIG